MEYLGPDIVGMSGRPRKIHIGVKDKFYLKINCLAAISRTTKSGFNAQGCTIIMSEGSNPAAE
jgi:hypothetical protein